MSDVYVDRLAEVLVGVPHEMDSLGMKDLRRIILLESETVETTAAGTYALDFDNIVPFKMNKDGVYEEVNYVNSVRLPLILGLTIPAVLFAGLYIATFFA